MSGRRALRLLLSNSREEQRKPKPYESGKLNEESVSRPTCPHGPGVRAKNSQPWRQMVGIPAKMSNRIVPIREATEPMFGAANIGH
jgi:hypothetical protein